VRKRDPKHKKNFVAFEDIKEYEGYSLKKNDHALINILSKNGIPPASSANSFELIIDDGVAYERMMAEIEHAQESIDITT